MTDKLDYNVGLVYKQDVSDISRLEKGQYVIAAESLTITTINATIHINEGDWIVKTNDGLTVVQYED